MEKVKLPRRFFNSHCHAVAFVNSQGVIDYDVDYGIDGREGRPDLRACTSSRQAVNELKCYAARSTQSSAAYIMDILQVTKQ